MIINLLVRLARRWQRRWEDGVAMRCRRAKFIWDCRLHNVELVLGRNVVKPIGQMAELARRISVDEIDEMAPKSLATMTRRSDELGQMARVFERMAQEVYAREQSLRQQVQELRIEIDEVKKARQVAQLVNTDTFQELRVKAQKLRQQRHETGTAIPDNNPVSSSDPPAQM